MKKWILFFLVWFLSLPNILAQPGNVGINTITPLARMHVVRNSASGGPLLSNALAIFEDNQNSFIHLSHTNNAESGILSGNQNTLIRSGLIFGLDSSILFRAGGNVNRMAIKNSNVGINTISPAAMLHVKDGSVLFTGPMTIPGPSNPPFSGEGTRMMWYPDKAAFRTGYVFAAQWDKDSIGDYSTAFGSSPKAKGIASVAMGDRTAATGFTSTAIGGFTSASGEYSTATGCNNQSIGWGSFTMGNVNSAVGDMSLAIGHQTKAKPFASMVLGRFNDTTAISSTLWNANDPVFIIGVGSSNATRKNAMTVMKNGRTGINTSLPLAMLHVKDSSVVYTALGALPPMPGNPPVSGGGTRFMWYPEKAAIRAGRVISTQWDKDSIGVHSTAFGLNTQAKGQSSMAVGLGAIANGNYAMSFGYGTIASGEFSTALGITNNASGSGSFASGGDSKASGPYASTFGYGGMASGNAAVAMGSSTKATALNATSMGFVTAARGENSTSMGYLTIARAYATLSIGRYNDTTNMTNLNFWTPTDPVFVIGNGTDHTNRSNAMTVLKNGKTGINTTTPDAMLHVIKDAPSNGISHSNAAAIFESDQNSYIQMSNSNTVQAGILSGNEETSVRSGLIFTADSSVQIRSGGNINRMTIKGNKVGINTIVPKAKIHVVGNAVSGGPLLSNAIALFEDNQSSFIHLSHTNATESGILSGNQNSLIRSGLVFGADSSILFRAGGNINRVVIKNGNVGINTLSPQAKLHVSEGTGGNNYVPTAEVIIEDNDDTYLQFSSPTNEESGILSGNAVTSIRSAIVFKPDSSVQISAGGGSTRLAITKTGNTGIGTTTPEAKLDVNGTMIIGANGTAITEIIKLTILSDVANVPANSTTTENFAVPNSQVSSTVFISPGSNLDPGLVIAYARVTAPGNVAVKFTNTTGAGINPGAMNFYITVIR